MAEQKHSFLTTLPGILTGLAAIVTASVTAYTLIARSSEPAAPQPQPSPTAALAPVAPTPEAPAPDAPATPQPTDTPSADTGAGGAFSVTAVVDDPDGYVNVRDGPSNQSRIVATVRLNETMRTHPQTGAWWLVRTRGGAQGYVYASRIRMIDG